MSMKFFNTTLDNGLTVIGELRPNAVSSALGFFVKTGARDEDSKVAGISHFLEHMMFKGTEKRSAIDISYELAALGASANAFTSEEATVYYATLLPEYLSSGIELFSDMLRPKFDPDEFDMEKKVILEEIALYKDKPTHVLLEGSLKAYFGNHPAGSSVIGSVATVGGISVEQMRGYHSARYAPNNIVFGVAGAFDWDSVVADVKNWCGKWKAADSPRATPPHQPVPLTKQLTQKEINRAHLVIIMPGPSVQEADRYPAQLWASVLGDISGSKLYWELVDTGICDTAYLDSEPMDGTGFIMCYASTFPDQVPQVLEIINRVLDKPLDFSEVDLKRAKTKTLTRLALQAESSSRRMFSIGLNWLNRREYLAPRDEEEIVKGLTSESLSSFIARYPVSNRTTVTLLPE